MLRNSYTSLIDIPKDPIEAKALLKNRIEYLKIQVDITKPIKLKLFYSRMLMLEKKRLLNLEGS